MRRLTVLQGPHRNCCCSFFLLLLAKTPKLAELLPASADVIPHRREAQAE